MAVDEIPDTAAGVSNAFRAGLRRELPRWRADGLVDEAIERGLVARYRLDEQAVDVTTAAIYLRFRAIRARVPTSASTVSW